MEKMAPLLQALVEGGANLRKVDDSGNTVLHNLVFNKSLYSDLDTNITPALDYILSQDESLVHMQDWDGNTPLHLALQLSSELPLYQADEIVSSLLRAGASLTVCNNEGETPFLYAARTLTTDDQLFNIIDKCEGDLQYADLKGRNFLHYAIGWHGVEEGINPHAFLLAMKFGLCLYIENPDTHNALRDLCIQTNMSKDILRLLILDNLIVSQERDINPNKKLGINLHINDAWPSMHVQELKELPVRMLCVAGFRVTVTNNLTNNSTSHGIRRRPSLEKLEEVVRMVDEFDR